MRMQGLIAGLAQCHSTSVLSLVSPGDNTESVRATQEYCDEVVTVENRHRAQQVSRKRRMQLASLFSPHSYERLVEYQPALQATLNRMLERSNYDFINVEFAQMSYYQFPNSTRLVLDEHNIEYDILRRTSVAEQTLGRKLYNYCNYLKLRHEERAAWRRFDGCTVTSARDQQLLLRDCPNAQTEVVPNAVDINFFRPSRHRPDPMTILFFGAIHYYPNTDALSFLVRDIMPQIRRRHPNARLVVVGSTSADLVTKFAAEGVTMTNAVPDVRPYIEQAAVVVSPLRIGGGTRLKILEAMAMGKPVVSTTIGAEGIDVTHGKDLLLADTASDFADEVGRLLDGPELAAHIGNDARQLIETTYDWRSSVAKLESFYTRLLAADVHRDEKAAQPERAVHSG